MNSTAAHREERATYRMLTAPGAANKFMCRASRWRETQRMPRSAKHREQISWQWDLIAPQLLSAVG